VRRAKIRFLSLRLSTWTCDFCLPDLTWFAAAMLAIVSADMCKACGALFVSSLGRLCWLTIICWDKAVGGAGAMPARDGRADMRGAGASGNIIGIDATETETGGAAEWTGG